MFGTASEISAYPEPPTFDLIKGNFVGDADVINCDENSATARNDIALPDSSRLRL